MQTERSRLGRVVVLTSIWSLVGVIALCILQSIVQDIYIETPPAPFTRAERLWCLRKTQALSYLIDAGEASQWKERFAHVQKTCKGKNAPEIETALETLHALARTRTQATTLMHNTDQKLLHLQKHVLPALAQGVP
jgi:hypothetical protein